MNILVVDDDPMILKIMELKLKSLNYNVIVADNAIYAIKLINEYDVNLVITDILMSNMSGVELLRHIKGLKDRKIHVIILSTLGQEDIVLEAFGIGADDYITKPFSPNVLAARVKRFEAVS